MLVCKLPEVFLFSAVYSNRVFQLLERQVWKKGKNWGEGKSSVWKNPPSLASHSCEAKNSSLHRFKTCSKKSQAAAMLLCKKRAGGPKGILKVIGPCNSRNWMRWSSQLRTQKRNTSWVMKNHERAETDKFWWCVSPCSTHLKQSSWECSACALLCGVGVIVCDAPVKKEPCVHSL